YITGETATTTSATAAATTSARRARKLMEKRSFLTQGVADAADGLNQPRSAAGFRLAPQIPDIDVERVRARAEVVAPHAPEDEAARQHLARVAEEQFKQRELGSRELDRLGPARHFACAEIELEVGEAQDACVRLGCSSQERAETGEQLVEHERLDEVVVGAGV